MKTGTMLNPCLLSRRELLRWGTLAPLGITAFSHLGHSSFGANDISKHPACSFGRAKRCLLFYLWGGPAHQDTFDLKPQAPAEYRGEFQPISTSSPGIQICEHFPYLARQMDKISLIRSVTHSDNNHSTSAHWMLTGHKHARSAENFQASSSDFPHIGSVVTKFTHSNTLPTFVAMPEMIGTTIGAVTPGQGGGLLGKKYDPFRINQHPDDPDFSVPNLTLPADISATRHLQRVSFLQQLEEQQNQLAAAINQPEVHAFQQQAQQLIQSQRVADAFALEKEPTSIRDAYGRGTFGQGTLLARRLLEAGVKLVTVYWHRDKPGVDTTWDTHSNNFPSLKTRLIPQVDQPIAQLLTELHERGLLDETLVVWMSEFGRSPRINKNGGRDHWGKCNTVWMAGAGIPGGQVHGTSDRIAAEPIADAVHPADISATIFHLLGLAPETTIYDNLNRPFPISTGNVLDRFIG